MARRSFTVVDVTEILIHWYAGRSLSEVSDSLGVDRKTIRYAACSITDLMPTGWLCRTTRRTLAWWPWSTGLCGITGSVIGC